VQVTDEDVIVAADDEFLCGEALSTTSALLRSAAFAASGRSIITTKRWN
jgi:hypothetical protein